MDSELSGKVKKETPVHRDVLGRLLKEGDIVAVAHHNRLMVGSISKLNPKMIKIREVGTKRSWASEYNKYGSECALLEGEDVTMWLLQNAGK